MQRTGRLIDRQTDKQTGSQIDRWTVRQREGSEPGARREVMPRSQRRWAPARAAGDGEDPGIAHLGARRPRAAAGSFCALPAEFRPTPAPAPASVGRAALIDASFTTQMANQRVVKAAGGDGDGRAALPRDSLESMEFMTLTYFLSPPEEHLLRCAALPARFQPPVWDLGLGTGGSPPGAPR